MAPTATIEVHSWPTPNGHKVHIMLEECRLPYRAHAVDIGAGEQFAPDFLAISPNKGSRPSPTPAARASGRSRCAGAPVVEAWLHRRADVFHR